MAAMCGSWRARKLLANAVELFLCIDGGCARRTAATGLVAPWVAETAFQEPTAEVLRGEVEEGDARCPWTLLRHRRRDEDEAPGAKYAALIAWAARLDVEDPTIWLDKACIDQNNVDRALTIAHELGSHRELQVAARRRMAPRGGYLASLADRLSRCAASPAQGRSTSRRAPRRGLLGSTLLSCSKGRRERVPVLKMTESSPSVPSRPGADGADRNDVIAIAGKDGTAAAGQGGAARQQIAKEFKNFNAASTVRLEDRERLLAVIEAGFGDFKEFNELVRDVFKTRSRLGDSGDAPGQRGVEHQGSPPLRRFVPKKQDTDDMSGDLEAVDC